MKIGERVLMATVCIDGFNLALQQGSGIATYGRNLLTDLHAIGHQTQVLYGPKSRVSGPDIVKEAILVDGSKVGRSLSPVARYLEALTAPSGKTAHYIPRSGNVLWPEDGAAQPPNASFWASRELFRTSHRAFQKYGRFSKVKFRGAQAPDVCHWTTPLPLYAPGSLNICTIHDLIPLRLPHSTSDDKRTFFDLFRISATSADHVVTVSETTRSDVISHLGIPPSKVTNVYQSVDVASSVSGLNDSILADVIWNTFGLKWKQYYLHYGNIEPKKNLGRIIEAYSQSLTQKRLVIVGGKGWLQDNEVSLLNAIRTTENPLSKKILYLEYMPHATLVTLIKGARATLFPSLYEGFGLPIIESMALGTAVLTTNFGAPKEIAGQSALLVDPMSVRSIKEGILALESDETVLSMASRGTKRAERFEPNRVQSSLKEVYEHVIQTHANI